METKRVLITGGSRGIGAECVRRFARSGCYVAFTYHENHRRARALCDELSEKVRAFCADFSKPDTVDSLISSVFAEFGEPDILVNNAGVASYALLQDTDPRDFDNVMNINLKAPFLLSRAFCQPMIAKKEGAIINISSIWGQTGASMETLYSASKAALIGFTKALSKELALSNVRVNCICPGVVETDMMAGFSNEEREEIVKEIPLGRFADPGEIADAVLFLSSDSASYITGQILSPNGGMLI